MGKGILSGYARRNKVISRCYIRHSAAFQPQNPFLSDFDVTFFVNSNDIQGLRDFRRQLACDFRKIIFLRNVIKDSIVLPDTENALNLCKKYYPFRSVYSFDTWMPFENEGEEVSLTVAPRARHALPLDAFPENFLRSYMIPVLKKDKRRHIFQSALIARNLKKDYSWALLQPQKKTSTSFYDTLLNEAGIWDKFYKNINFTEAREKAAFHHPGRLGRVNFMERWRAVSLDKNDLQGLSSLWVYPATHNDYISNVSLNLNPSVCANSCRKIINKVLRAFDGLKYNLIIGTEEAMMGRINGLSGAYLLEPWLFKYCGSCLFGNEGIREKIKEPTMYLLKEKYWEFLLCLMISSGFINQGTYPYAVYRLCFTLDYLFKHNEIILDNDRLSEIYVSEFIPEARFNPDVDTVKFLSILREKHNFYLFGN